MPGMKAWTNACTGMRHVHGMDIEKVGRVQAWRVGSAGNEGRLLGHEKCPLS